jgi:hypothetical protein
MLDNEAAITARVATMNPKWATARNLDNWEVSLAIAEVAGGHWPARAKEAFMAEIAERQTAERPDTQAEANVHILSAVQAVFDFADKHGWSQACMDALADAAQGSGDASGGVGLILHTGGAQPVLSTRVVQGLLDRLPQTPWSDWMRRPSGSQGVLRPALSEHRMGKALRAFKIPVGPLTRASLHPRASAPGASPVRATTLRASTVAKAFASYGNQSLCAETLAELEATIHVEEPKATRKPLPKPASGGAS